MSAQAATEYAPLDKDACTHQLTILKALNCARPLLYRGQENFVQVVHARLAGGRVEMDVWLTGNPERVDPSELTVPGRPA